MIGRKHSMGILLCVLPAFLAADLAAAEMVWQAPEDGGTPRDPARIVQVGPHEFRIGACAEEGPVPLTHAASRMDLLCRNSGNQAAGVAIHVDLSDDGRRTNRDQKPWGDMPRRDYLYVQPPGQPWRRVDGSVSGWVCTVRFTAAPGETKVGLSPWYTYGDYLRFVESLPAQPHLRKERIGTSDGGQPTSKKQVHHTDKVRRSAWRIVCAGGYFAAGFVGTLGHSDAWNRIDAPNRYSFVVKDQGAAAQLGLLHDFFVALPFWRMQPFEGVTGEAVALAERGQVYVVHLPQGGKVAVDLGDTKGTLTARWFNPRHGTLGQPFEVAGGGRSEFQAIDGHDWVLHLSVPAQ